MRRRTFLKGLGALLVAGPALPELLPKYATGGVVDVGPRLITSCTLFSVEFVRDAPHLAEVIINREMDAHMLVRLVGKTR